MIRVPKVLLKSGFFDINNKWYKRDSTGLNPDKFDFSDFSFKVLGHYICCFRMPKYFGPPIQVSKDEETLKDNFMEEWKPYLAQAIYFSDYIQDDEYFRSIISYLKKNKIECSVKLSILKQIHQIPQSSLKEVYKAILSESKLHLQSCANLDLSLLPVNVKYVIFGVLDIRDLSNLPSSVSSVEFNDHFNPDILKSLPGSVLHVCFGCVNSGFLSELPKSIPSGVLSKLPKSISHVSFKNPISSFTLLPELPDSVRSLRFFIIPAKATIESLPCSIKYINFISPVNKGILEVLPPTVKSLCFHSMKCGPSLKILPEHVTRVSFLDSITFDALSEIPKSVKVINFEILDNMSALRGVPMTVEEISFSCQVSEGDLLFLSHHDSPGLSSLKVLIFSEKVPLSSQGHGYQLGECVRYRSSGLSTLFLIMHQYRW